MYADNYKVIEIENGSKLTKESIYLLTAIDKAGNETSIYVAVDKTAPVFTTVKNGHQYNKDIEIKVEDLKVKTIELYSYNDKTTKTIENGYVLKEEGTYAITATDYAGRSTKVYVTIDKTKPVLKAANILVDGDKNEQKYFYAKIGDTIYSYVRFNEELKENPTFTLVNNGKKYEVKDVTKRAYDNGEYGYSIKYTIDENTEMTDGEIEMLVTNIKDRAGNEYGDITKPTNGHVVYLDTKAPERVHSTLDFDKSGKEYYENENKQKEFYVTNNDSFVFRMQFTEKLQGEPILNVGKLEIPLVLNQKHLTNEGKYIYEGTVNISEEAGLSEGKIEFTLSNVVDEAGNVTTDKVVLNQTPTSNARIAIYDVTAPKKVALKINSSNENKEYGKVGDSFGVYLTVDEELRENPTFTINGKEYKVNQSEKVNSGYKYAAVYPITDDMQDGEVEFTISNIYDKAGNKLEDLTNKDTSEKLVIDNTKASVTLGGATGAKNWFTEQTIDVTVKEANLDSIYYAFNKSSNDKNMHNILDSDSAIKVDPKDIIDNGDGTYTVKILLNKEGRYVLNVKVIDKSGNTVYTRRGWYQIDRTKPEISLHKNTEEKTIEPGNHNYCVSATVEEANLKSFTLNGQNYDGSVICADGDHTLVATDKAGNKDEMTFRVDRTRPVIAINGVDYEGTENKGLFFNKVDLEIKETNDYEVSVWKDNQKIDFNEVNFNENGSYKIQVKDAALNKSEVEFTVDTIPAAKVDIRVNSNNSNERYAKVGDKVGIYLNVDEELRENPTFVINGQTYEVNQTAVNNGKYMYAVLFDVTDETKEGEVEFTISNIYDKAGNKSEDLSNNNTEEYVIVDKTAPVYKSLGIYGGEKYNDTMYVTNGDRIYINVHFSEKLAVSPYVKINGEEVFQYGEPVEQQTANGEKYYIYSKVYNVNNKEGRLSFEIYGYADAAGNEGKTLTADDTTIGGQTGNIVVDNTAPSIGDLESNKEYTGSIHYEMSDNSGSFKLYYDLDNNFQSCDELIAKGTLFGTLTDTYKGDYYIPGSHEGISVCLVDAAGNKTFRNNISIKN